MRLTDELTHAEWTYRIPEGEIRRLLKYRVTYYFGGGLPGALPTEKLATIVRDLGQSLLDQVARGEEDEVCCLFNYAKTSGMDSLRELLMQRLVERQGLHFDPATDFHKMLITAGSQQSLYAVLDVTINPGDYILTAAPSYLGFVTPANKLGGRVVLCPSDQQGLTVEGVEEAIAAIKREAGVAPKLLYVIADSDNPKGTTLPADRRRALFDIAEREDILIVEDAAYKEIQFGQERLAPIKTFDADNTRVAYLASTSKEAGVLRLGYTIFPELIREQVEKAKGFYDLCCPSLTQKIAEHYYRLDMDAILTDVLARYRRRCAAMVESIDQFFPEGLHTRPTGGFFVWWEAPSGVPFDSKRFNEEVAIPNDILFVPSHAFYPPEGFAVDDRGHLVSTPPRTNGMRLSFSAVPKAVIREGIEKLGTLLKHHL